MKEDFRDGVGRVVDVNESLLSGIAMIGVVEVYVDGVVHTLLPGCLLSHNIRCEQ
jgi:hypothetical protein